MEAHLKIVSLKEVELADGDAPAVTTDHPEPEREKEIARVTANRNVNCRV
jgi:hypothetical protein